jgi:hypothetical protein
MTRSGKQRVIGILLGAALATAWSTEARAQAVSNVDPAHPHAWAENAGWTDWHDADGGSDGVIVAATYLGGYVWSENLGWLNLGDGTPTNFVSYANVDGTDFGVNIDLVTGNLSGLAWGENVGWINFDTASAGADRARFDPCTQHFEGYAWAENLGRLNLGVDLEAYDPADDLGFALAGTGLLAPELCAYGVLSSGNSFVLRLHDALPSALSALYVGLAPNPTPFKGGMLVPVPVLLELVLLTNANGLWVLVPPAGTGSVAVDVVLQAAVLDPGAPNGISLSNALTLHMLP